MRFQPVKPRLLAVALAGLMLVAAVALGYRPAAEPAHAQGISEQDRILVEELLFRAQGHFVYAYLYVDGQFLDEILVDPELTHRAQDIYERYTVRGVYGRFKLEDYRLLDVQFADDVSGWAVTYEEWSGELRTIRADALAGRYYQKARHVYTIVWTDEGWKIAREEVEAVTGDWQSGPLAPTPTTGPTLTPAPPTATLPPQSPTATPPPGATPTNTPLVPTPGVATSTPTLTPTPSITPTPTTGASPTPTPSPTFVAGAFRISTFDGRSNPERVVIINTSGQQLDLGSWSLLSTRGNQRFVIPNVTFVQPSQSITIVSGDAARRENDQTLVWTNAFIFNDDADGVQLINPNQQVVDAKAYP